MFIRRKKKRKRANYIVDVNDDGQKNHLVLFTIKKKENWIISCGEISKYIKFHWKENKQKVM